MDCSVVPAICPYSTTARCRGQHQRRTKKPAAAAHRHTATPRQATGAQATGRSCGLAATCLPAGVGAGHDRPAGSGSRRATEGRSQERWAVADASGATAAAIYRLSSPFGVGSGYRVPATVALRPLLSMGQCRRTSTKTHDSTKAPAARRNSARPSTSTSALQSPRLPSAGCASHLRLRGWNPARGEVG